MPRGDYGFGVALLRVVRDRTRKSGQSFEVIQSARRVTTILFERDSTVPRPLRDWRVVFEWGSARRTFSAVGKGASSTEAFYDAAAAMVRQPRAIVPDFTKAEWTTIEEALRAEGVLEHPAGGKVMEDS
jgi:hypothetical protein